jgi:hypothetical protein
MRISELLNENTPPKSALPTAASLDDAPEELDGEDETTDENVDNFKKISSKFGPDLYSFSSLVYYEDWEAPNSVQLNDLLNGIKLDGLDKATSAMRRFSGDYGSMGFIIVNGRTGQATFAGLGENDYSDGIQMNDLDPDQMSVVNKINTLSTRYAQLGGGESDRGNSEAERIRSNLLHMLEYNKQPEKEKSHIDRTNQFGTPEQRAARDARFHSPENVAKRKALLAKIRAERRGTNMGAGRETR